MRQLRNKLDRPFGRAVDRDGARRRLPARRGRRLTMARRRGCGRCGSARRSSPRPSWRASRSWSASVALVVVARSHRSRRTFGRRRLRARRARSRRDVGGAADRSTAGEADDEFVQIVDRATASVVGLRARTCAAGSRSIALAPARRAAAEPPGRRRSRSSWSRRRPRPTAPHGARGAQPRRRGGGDRGGCAACWSSACRCCSLVVAASRGWIDGPGPAPGGRDARRGRTISAGTLDRRVAEPATGDEIARLAATMNRMLGAAGSRRERGSADSSPTPRTSCARRWRRSASTARSRSRTPSATSAGTSPMSCIARPCGSSASSTTCCCSRGSTRAAPARRSQRRPRRHGPRRRRARVRRPSVAAVDTSGVGAGPRARARRRSSRGRCATSSTTPRRHAIAARRRLGCETTTASPCSTVDDDGPGIRRPTIERGSSTGSCASTTRAPATTAGPGSGLAIVRGGRRRARGRRRRCERVAARRRRGSSCGCPSARP